MMERLFPRTPMSARRRIAIASYTPPHEGVIHGSLTLDCTRVVRYLEDLREATGKGVTITAFMGAVVARALEAEPTLNGRIHMGHYIPYDRINISFLVQMQGGHNLAQVLIEDVDQLSALEVFEQLRQKASQLRSGRDDNFEKSMKLTGKLPTPVLRRVLSLGGFVTSGLGLPFAGQPAFPFGSATITSVGMLGVDEAFVPPTPFLRVPLYVTIGALRDMLFAEDGQAVVKPGITLTATLDHRFVDGYQAATVSRVVRDIFEHPELVGPIPALPADAAESGARQDRSAS